MTLSTFRSFVSLSETMFSAMSAGASRKPAAAMADATRSLR